MAKLVVTFIVLCSFLIGYAQGQDACPAASRTADKTCTFKLNNKANHFRDCDTDIYMSLCSLMNAVYDQDVPTLRSFMCSNVNYCSGCRDCYTLCCDETDKNCTVDALGNYLGWYDAFTLGGKFVVCDFTMDYLNSTIYSDGCVKGRADGIGKCIQNLTDAVYNAYDTESITCDVMDKKINCFMDELDHCDTDDSKNILLQYFQGVVSLSPCAGQIESVGGRASLTIASVATVMLSILIAMTLSRA